MGLSTAILHQLNWRGLDHNSISFTTDVDYSWDKSGHKSEQYFKLNLDIGFTWHPDSIWHKHIDTFQSQYMFKADKKRFSQTGSALITGGFLNDYEYTFNSITGKTDRTKIGSFFMPSSFETGVGSGYSFFQHSVINVSLATARLRLVQRKSQTREVEGIIIGSSSTKSLFFDYGFSIQYYISKELNRFMELKANGKMFIKEFHRSNIEIDLRNDLSIKLTRHFRIKADIKVVYAPAFSYKFQFRNEFLLGLFYETVTSP